MFAGVHTKMICAHVQVFKVKGLAPDLILCGLIFALELQWVPSALKHLPLCQHSQLYYQHLELKMTVCYYLVFTMHHIFPACTTFVRGLNKIPPRAITSILFFTFTWRCSPCLGPTNRCWTFSRWWIYSVSDGSGSWEVTSVTRLVLEYDLWKEDN